MTGYLLLLLLGRQGALGSLLSLLGVQVVFTWGAAVIAAAVVSLPFAKALGEFGATLMVADNLPGRTGNSWNSGTSCR